ncbi:virulence factor SrfC family protein [Entomohabitans teleogrylli]|uniref:virulence factor SrfC family protein n=1 Tax=Entomohabitans teleogrylli TaxID=1384589 RepID=UPI00073D5805|nr:virulence factor SrfC family protein [Entomohabitans teleogrylli]
MKPSTTPQQLADWVSHVRQHCAYLDAEADGRLGRLAQLQHQHQQLAMLSVTPLTLGLYGHATASKRHLLNALLAENSDRLGVTLGDQTFDYLQHIHRGPAASIAVRFTDTAPPRIDGFPLLLELFSEYQLAQRLVTRYHSRRDAQLIPASAMSARLHALQQRRQPQPVAGMTRAQFASVAQRYQTAIPGGQQADDGLLYRMADLAAWLAPGDRAALLALLWGEDAQISACWHRQSRALIQLGNAPQALAPASLALDDAEDFLCASEAGPGGPDSEVAVCPLQRQQVQPCQSINRRALREICAGVTFTLSQPGALADVDIIDIPVDRLEEYSERQQPDMLLICNAASDQHDTPAAAAALTRWQEKTGGGDQNAHPRLIWAITPFDGRFRQTQHFDDHIQQHLTRDGKRWGALQALDDRSMDRLRAWLSNALGPARHQREQQLQATINHLISAQFSALLPASDDRQAEPAKALVRTLQSRAPRFSELLERLTLPRDTIHQCWLEHQQQQQIPALPELDLFVSDDTPSPAAQGLNCFSRRLYQRWVNHLRQLSHNPSQRSPCSLPAATLQALCDLLIDSAYRLQLPAILEDAVARHQDNMALAISSAENGINNFVGWLGYQQIAPELRPRSKVNKETAVFAPARQASAARRLTQLGEPPAQGNACYFYDWLVALYHRAMESDAAPQHGISEIQQRALRQLLNALCQDTDIKKGLSGGARG